MDEIELMHNLADKAKINPTEGIYVIRGEALLRAVIRELDWTNADDKNPRWIRLLYNEAKSAFVNEVIINSETELLDAGFDAAIELALENIRELAQHPEETA